MRSVLSCLVSSNFKKKFLRPEIWSLIKEKKIAILSILSSNFKSKLLQLRPEINQKRNLAPSRLPTSKVKYCNFIQKSNKRNLVNVVFQNAKNKLLRRRNQTKKKSYSILYRCQCLPISKVNYVAPKSKETVLPYDIITSLQMDIDKRFPHWLHPLERKYSESTVYKKTCHDKFGDNHTPILAQFAEETPS